MLPLVVHIERSPGGPVITRAFHESPVRIGRSPFASLRLREPFVSEWQAVVRFHGERTTYLDLGSRNPTNIEGKPIERNVEVEINTKTDVRIGTLRLRFERIAAPREDPEQAGESDTAFVADQLLAKERPTGTIILKEFPEARGFGASPPPPPPPARSLRPSGSSPAPAPGRSVPPPLAGSRPQSQKLGVPGSAPPPPPAPRISGQVPVPQRASPAPAHPALQADSLALAERMLDDARSVYLEAVKREIDEAPLAQRAQRVRELAAQSSKLIEEPAFRNWARANGVEPIELGYVDVGNWLARLCGSSGTTPKPEHLALTMERAGQLLELFASAFIDSRRAHQRARQKLGLSQALESKTTLVSTEDPHALLAHLLEPGPAVQARSQELRRMLGDFAMHQIALLSAVVEGARAMLTQLSPRAIENVPDANIDSGVLDNEPTAAGWGFAARKLWRKYLVRHHDLTHTDHFARELFGREFTRRYHAIADSASHVERPERT